MSGAGPNYRPDIDGLRAVAVLAVVVFHAFPAVLPGGLVGVDIFFVISGYLITGVITSDLASGRFTLAHFYLRRIRRIFPALAAMLTVITLAAWACLLPDEWRNYGKHLFAGTAFVANLALAREVDYFDFGARFKPLLHLWSLGVEEQFYFVWPLLLALLWKTSRRVLIGVVGIVLLGSFVLNVVAIGRYPSLTFYLPFTRIWELAIGSLLALAGSRIALSRRAAEAAGWSGAVLLVASMLLIRENESFPGAWALLPTIGTALIIAAGETASFNRLVLDRRAAVDIGLISYPLYLWHWPLLSLALTAGGGARSALVTFGCVAAAFALSWLTYRFVEQPIRTSPVYRRRLIAVSALLVVLAALGWAVNARRIEPRLSSPAIRELLTATTEWEYPFGMNFGRTEGFVTSTVPGTAPGVVLFIGDSHLEQYFPRLKLLAERGDAPELRFATNGGCPPLPGTDVERVACRAYLDFALAEARKQDVTTVVLGACWQIYLKDGDAPAAAGRLGAEIRSLEQLGKRVVVILSTPASPRLDPRKMVSRRSGEIATQPLPVSEFLAANGAVIGMIRDAAAGAGAEVIDPLPLLCPDGICPTVTGGRRPVYRDWSHMRPFYARERAVYIDRALVIE